MANYSMVYLENPGRNFGLMNRIIQSANCLKKNKGYKNQVFSPTTPNLQPLVEAALQLTGRKWQKERIFDEIQLCKGKWWKTFPQWTIGGKRPQAYQYCIYEEIQMAFVTWKVENIQQ